MGDSVASQSPQTGTQISANVPPLSGGTTSNQSTPSQKQQNATNSNKGLIVSIIVVVVVVIGVGVYAFVSKQSSVSSQAMNSLTTQVSHAPVMSPTPSGTMQMQTGTQAAGLTTGSTNADLTQDANTLNKGLDSANSEMTNADQGLNDKPADLSQ